MTELARFDDTHSFIQEDADGIIRVKFGVATSNEKEAIREAKWLVDTFEYLKTKRPDKPIFVLVDMTSIDDSEYIPGEVWKMYLDLVKDPFLKRVAVVGGTEAMRNIINFYFRFWTREDVKFFQQEQEAIEWLKKPEAGQKGSN